MDRPEPAVRSHAEVATPRADRWVRQLASHLGRRAQVAEEAGWTVLRLSGGGECSMTGTGDAVVLRASAPDEATLAVVQDVVGGHLERFAGREGLRVVWERLD